MKIVYYFEPWVELERPELKYHNLRYQLGPQIEDMINNGHDVTIVLGDSLYKKCERENYIFDAANYSVIEQGELRDIFDNYLSATCKIVKGELTREQEHSFTNLIVSKIDGEPDVIISFLSPIEPLRYFYKNTILLYCEFGIFSRTPYPRTFYFDKNGMFKNSYLRNLPEYIKIRFDDFKVPNLEKLKTEVIYKGLMKVDPFYNINFNDGSFKKIVLLPLQFSEYFGFDAYSPYKSQFEYLIDILERVPNDIGVLVTEHVGWKPVITQHNLEYLKSTYKNFIFVKDVYNYRNSSQFLLDKVDGVISVSSSVALQAMMFDKPIFCEWESHLKDLSVVDSISDINNFFESGKKVNYSEILDHLITEYYLTEDEVYDSKRFIERVINNKRDGDTSYSKYLNSVRIDLLEKHVQEDRVKNKLRVSSYEKNILAYDDSLRRKILDSDVVSFDIFDTLLERPFQYPHLLFLAIQEKVREYLNSPTFEFHKLRRLSEHLVRGESEYEEVTIYEIYEKLAELSSCPISKEQIDELVDIELEAELAFCHPKESGKLLYDFALERGKKISIISDFYVGNEFLEKLLNKNGYSGHEVCFSSCDYRATKHSGKIYTVLKDEVVYSGKRVIHFGDNFVSDVQNARDVGWDALHVEKASKILEKNPNYKAIWDKEWKRNVYPSNNTQLSHGTYFGLISNQLAGHPKKLSDISLFSSDPFNFGYVALGPLFYSFVSDLFNNTKRDGVKKLLFLSRDGWLIKRAFDVINDGSIESVYLPSSRKSYMLSVITDSESFSKTLETPFSPTSISNLLLTRYCVDSSQFDFDQELIDSGLDSLEQKVHPIHQLVYLKKFFNLIYPKLKDHFDKYHYAFEQFLVEHKLRDNDNMAVVDIGYSGSLQEILINKGVKNLRGYYFLTHAKALEISKIYNVNIRGFTGNFIDHQNTDDFYCNNISFIETIFSSDEGSLKEILFINGEVKYKLENSYCSSKRTSFINRLQAGVIEFISDYKGIGDKIGTELILSPTFAEKTFKQFLISPRRFDAEMIVDIEFDDSFSSKARKCLVCKSAELSLWKSGFNVVFGQNGIKTADKKTAGKVTRQVQEKTKSTSDNNRPTTGAIWSSRIKRLKANPRKLFLRARYTPIRKIAKAIWN